MKTKKLFLPFYSIILYLFAFICCLSANAQLHFDLEVANKTNEVFGPLDKSKIPHSMLLDYGYDFVDVPNYDGVLRDNNYIVPSVFRDLYNSVVSMRTSLVVPELVDPIALEQGQVPCRKIWKKALDHGHNTQWIVLPLFPHTARCPR